MLFSEYVLLLQTPVLQRCTACSPVTRTPSTARHPAHTAPAAPIVQGCYTHSTPHPPCPPQATAVHGHAPPRQQARRAQLWPSSTLCPTTVHTHALCTRWTSGGCPTPIMAHGHQMAAQTKVSYAQHLMFIQVCKACPYKSLINFTYIYVCVVFTCSMYAGFPQLPGILENFEFC